MCKKCRSLLDWQDHWGPMIVEELTNACEMGVVWNRTTNLWRYFVPWLKTWRSELLFSLHWKDFCNFGCSQLQYFKLNSQKSFFKWKWGGGGGSASPNNSVISEEITCYWKQPILSWAAVPVLRQKKKSCVFLALDRQSCERSQLQTQAVETQTLTRIEMHRFSRTRIRWKSVWPCCVPEGSSRSSSTASLPGSHGNNTWWQVVNPPVYVLATHLCPV